MEDIIDLRNSIEELEDLPLSKWKELQQQRKSILRQELKRIKKALEFVENATVEEFKERALNYKRYVEGGVLKKEAEERWPPKKPKKPVQVGLRSREWE